jgi:hydrogenase expression/formation protein HypC
MCFGIPMQIQSIDGFFARCTAKGAEREANLFMLQYDLPQVGDHVVVYQGYAIGRVSVAQAADAWDIYDQLLAADTVGGHPAGDGGMQEYGRQ